VQDSEFSKIVDELVIQLEDELDELAEEHGIDLDIDTSGGLLTVVMENGSTIVLSRQISNQEIWVAARSGGYHCAFINGDWFCGTSSETLSALLGRVFTEQIGLPVSLL
jgi:CyaY protein